MNADVGAYNPRVRRNLQTQFSVKLWFPVVPFIVYWLVTLLFYVAGPFEMAALRIETFAYVLFSLTGFALFYRISIGDIPSIKGAAEAVERKTATSIVKLTSALALVGIAGLVLDRLYSGAGSFTATLQETAKVRESMSFNTTLLTTLSVPFDSFYLVSLAAYFFCQNEGVRLSWRVHASIIATVSLHCVNSFLGVGRGEFFAALTYALFYLMFVKGMTVREIIFSRRFAIGKLGIALFVVVLGWYTFFIARNRNPESTLKSLGLQSAQIQRYPMPLLTDEASGALYQLVCYGTHEFQFIDAFLCRAKLLDFKPGHLLGLRASYQVSKVFPDFTSASVSVAEEWTNDAGLSNSGWPSAFGWTLAMFGVCGAIAFFLALGAIAGRLVRGYLRHRSLGFLILVLSTYAGLNVSWNWIFGEFSHMLGYVVGGWLAVRPPKSWLVSVRGSMGSTIEANQR